MEEGGEAKGGQGRVTHDQVHRIPGRPIITHWTVYYSEKNLQQFAINNTKARQFNALMHVLKISDQLKNILFE